MYKLLVIGIMFLLGLYYIYKSNNIETFVDGEEDTEYKIAGKCPDVLIQKGAAFFLYNSKRANVPGVNPIRFENLEEYTEFTEWQRSQGILCPVLYLQHAYDAQGEPVYKARPSPTNLQGGQQDYTVTEASLFPNGGLMQHTGLMSQAEFMPQAGSMPQAEFMPQAGSMPQASLMTQSSLMPQAALMPQIPNIPPNIMPPPDKYPIHGIYGRSEITGAMPKTGAQIPQTGVQMPYNGQMQMQMPYNGQNLYAGFDPQNQNIGSNTPLDKMFNQTFGVSPNPMDDNWGGVEFTENLVKAGYYKDNEVSIAGA